MTVHAFALRRALPRCFRSFLQRCAAAACAAFLFAAALPVHAASSVEVVNVILTSRFLEQERCDNLGLVNIGLLQGLHRGVGVNMRPELSAAQVREIATRYVEINEQLCNALTPMFAEHDAWASNYEKYARSNLSNKAWDEFLADERAVKWAGIAARFRTELIILNNAVDLVLALRPDAFNPDSRQMRGLLLPEKRKLLDDIRRVSLTDDEAKVRLMLATSQDQPAFRAMLPARFNLDSLVIIETKTRQIGLQLVNGYRVHFDELYNHGTRMLLFTTDNKPTGPQLDSTVRTASTQIKALASKYR
ncbi:hypothetical protein [Telluria aromaticivorans]|uniref:Uncharacterized protein n=1 Tax=Telluria aromaticivorans TaxID=2725995 RepID=A0A7Y2K0L1_9BURK|nr:hypothetical protein [Telluria aromaticivorans]NNG24435.1 hypothetical protein [Telluria aromaticivorans]